MLPSIDAPTLLARPARWASVLRWATVAGLELGAIGPFGSYKGNLYSRLAYWTVLLWIGAAAAWPCIVATLAYAPRRGWPPLFAAGVAMLALCVPLAAVSAAGCYLLWPVHASGIAPLEWYGLTTMVVLPATAGLLWLELARWSPAAAAAPALAGVTPTGAPSGLPAPLAATALCLQMEDYFVRVHTLQGSHLHGATLGRALLDVAHRPGVQVHRSWWVAREAVVGWRQDGRATGLVLVTGLDVPVARQRVAMLRAAGWLRPDDRISPGTG